MKKSIFTNWARVKVCPVCDERIEGDEENFEQVYKDHVKACQDSFMKEQMGLSQETD